MFSINPLRFFRRTQAIVAEAYRGASKMGKGKKLKSSSVTADFEKFENFFYQDSHVFGIITCIADSMSESGLSFTHSDRDTSDQANNMVSEYEMDTMVSELTVANMVFGNSFTVLDPAESDFDFLEQLSPRYITVQKNRDGRHDGWKYKEGDFDAALTIEQTLHIPVNRLAGSTWGTSPLQPLTRILDLKGNIEVNLDHLVTRYLVPRYVYLLGRQGTSVPQEVIDEFAKSLADPEAAQDQVFENNLEIMTMGTQYKALHVGYILDYIHQSVYSGLAFPDSFHVAAGSTESCYSEDTQTLTKNGWKFFWEINENEEIATYNPQTGSIEYHIPANKFVHDYEGPMLNFRNKFTDILVTPNHRMYVRKYRGTDWEILHAEDITYRCFHVKRTFDWEGKEVQTFTLPASQYDKQARQPEQIEKEIPMDTWLEFLGYFLTDGGTLLRRNEYRVTITQVKEPHKEKIRQCLEKLPFKIHLNKSHGSYNNFVIHDKSLWTYLHLFGTKKERLILPEYKGLSKRQLRILLDAIIVGDGTPDSRPNRTVRTVYVSSKKFVDDIQEIALKCGYSASILKGVSCSRIQIYENYKEPKLLRKNIETIHYKGRVYCFEIPTHLFITRRNGKIAIQGNTAKIQAEIFSKKRIGGLHKVYANPVKQILSAIFDKEGIKYDKIPEPKWGQLSQVSLESRVEYLSKLAGIVDGSGNRVIQIPELRKFVQNELGIEMDVHVDKPGAV